jgi:WS/DGAT/MGAT family acyltransferase
LTDRLSNLDAAFLASRWPDHHAIAFRVIVFEGPAPGFEAFLDHVRSRIVLVPRLMHRITPVPLGLRAPEWTRDRAFDLARHVRPAPVERPGSEEELRSAVTALYEGPVDTDAPPWRLWYLEGLAGGRFAIAMKLHHAMADGLSVGRVARALFPEDGGADEVLGGPGTAADTPAAIAARGAIEAVREPLRAAVRHARGRRLSRLARHDAADAVAAVRSARRPGAAPPTKLNRGPRGPRRRLDWLLAPLSEVRAVKLALDTTLNNVILAAVAGGLRLHLARTGDLEHDLLAMVPISVRGDADARTLGNRVNVIYVELPVTEADAGVRVRRVAAAVRRSLGGLDQPGLRTVGALTQHGPPALARRLRERHLGGELFNLAVTNTGPHPRPLRCCGRRALVLLPTAPPTPHHGLAVVALSYLDTMAINLTADSDRVPDSAAIAEDLGASVRELRELALREPGPAAAGESRLFGAG